MDMSARNPIDRSYEDLVDRGAVGIGRYELTQRPTGRFSAIVHGCAPCAFSGCDELAFTESSFGPVCEGHVGAVTIR